MAKINNLYEKKRQEKKETQIKTLQTQNASIKKNRQENKGKILSKGGLMGLYQTITDLILSLLGDGNTSKTAQETLPYKQMYKDGLCRVKDGVYSRTIQFYDINYRLSKDERKSRIFNLYCSLLNSVDNGVHLQLSFHNLLIDLEELKKDVEISFQEDGLDDVRQGYSQYLKEQLEAGRNEVQRVKFITFTVEEEDTKKARAKLQRIEDDLLHQLRSIMKVPARSLRGVDRLRIMQESMRDSPKDKLHYDFTEQAKSGLTSHDCILQDKNVANISIKV